MAGVLSKLRLVFLSNAHALLDKVIDQNSPEALKQIIRDFEDATEKLESETAVAQGNLRTLSREKGDLEARAAKLDQTIDMVLNDGNPANDHIAVRQQAELLGVNEELATLAEELETATRTAQEMSEAVSSMQSKHSSLVQALRRLESLNRKAEAQSDAARAIKAAVKATSSGADVSVDSVRDRLERKADVAQVEFEQATGSLAAETGKDVLVAQAQALIAERKKRLLLPASTSGDAGK